jgi:hypothetical protein
MQIVARFEHLEFEDNQEKINEERRTIINAEKEEAMHQVSNEDGQQMINTGARSAEAADLFVSSRTFC